MNKEKPRIDFSELNSDVNAFASSIGNIELVNGDQAVYKTKRNKLVLKHERIKPFTEVQFQISYDFCNQIAIGICPQKFVREHRFTIPDIDNNGCYLFMLDGSQVKNCMIPNEPKNYSSQGEYKNFSLIYEPDENRLVFINGHSGRVEIMDLDFDLTPRDYYPCIMTNQENSKETKRKNLPQLCICDINSFYNGDKLRQSDSGRYYHYVYVNEDPPSICDWGKAIAQFKPQIFEIISVFSEMSGIGYFMSHYKWNYGELEYSSCSDFAILFLASGEFRGYKYKIIGSPDLVAVPFSGGDIVQVIYDNIECIISFANLNTRVARKFQLDTGKYQERMLIPGVQLQKDGESIRFLS
jgi:hypothetical protein